MSRWIRNLGMVLCIVALAGLISLVLSPFFQEHPELRTMVRILTASAALLTLVLYFSGEDSSTVPEQEDPVKETLEELEQDGPLSKDELQELGQAGTLAVYASEEAAESYRQLPIDEREDLKRRLKSVRRGGVGDVSARPRGRRSQSSSIQSHYFKHYTPKFDVGFILVKEKPSGAELLNISNREADTDIGLYIDRIVERRDRLRSMSS